MQLTKAERNDLFRALSEGGLNPLSCVVRESQGIGLEISHEGTRSTFSREGPQYGRWSGIWHVGTDPIRAWAASTWSEMVVSVRQWARAAREWEESPDLWALAAEATEQAALEAISGNALFSADEQVDIARHIDVVKAQVRETFELEAGQLEGIDQKLDELKDASTRVGPKDWRIMLYGAAFGMIVNDAIPPGVVQSILGMVIHGVAHILGVPGLPPALPA